MIQTIRPQVGLRHETGASISVLIHATWPSKPGITPPTVNETLAEWQRCQSTHFVITEDDTTGGNILAHALIFRRTIHTSRGPIDVGALAKVCVHRDFRGRGWGADVVRAAFDYLPELGTPVSLFQTGVPRFYENLGCRLVTNRFVNGDDPNNPFWDTHEMIYPAAFDWPDGQIDLSGPGY